MRIGCTILSMMILSEVVVSAEFRLPEPPAVIYGTVSIDGLQQHVDDNVTVFIQLPGSLDPIDSYHIGDDERYQDYYVLTVPLESLVNNNTTIVLKGTDLSISQNLEIYIVSPNLTTLARTFVIPDRGALLTNNINIMVSPDSDGDTVTDQREIAWGLNPNSIDSDGDGLSDRDEVCYDGDCSTYNPYDPLTDSGTDLNATSTDSDADGMPDFWELMGQLDPLKNDAYVDSDGDGHTNIQEYLRGSQPNDASSLPGSMILYVDVLATGGGTGVSWLNAHRYLQDALSVALWGDEIRVAQGVYRPDLGADQTIGDRKATFRLVNGVTIMGGFAGLSQGDPNKRDLSLYSTILSGDLANNDIQVSDPYELLTEPTLGENSLHVIMVNECNETTVLDGLTITAGNANGTDNPDNRGGGLFLDNVASPILRDCIFVNNVAAFLGGGIYCDYNSQSDPNLIRCSFLTNAATSGAGLYSHTTCSPTLTNCLLEGNVANTGNGGAISIYLGNSTLYDCVFRNNIAQTGGGLHSNLGEYKLINCVFEENVALDFGGGLNDINGVPKLSDCIFNDNFSGRGGGISLRDGTVAELSRCIFNGNQVDVHGGAIYISNTESDTLTSCMFMNNTAGSNGGGILAYQSGFISTNCFFAGNSAENGGGVFNHNNNTCVIAGCVLSANTASHRGGGLCNWDCSAPTYSVNCTYAGNTAAIYGGAIYDTNSVPTLVNSILWDNEAILGRQVASFNGTSRTISYSDVDTAQSGIYTEGSTINWTGDNIESDPLFTHPAGNDGIPGTSDDDLYLSEHSPCIEVGHNGMVPDDMLVDIVGNPRFVDSDLDGTAAVDLGAYEYIPLNPDIDLDGRITALDSVLLSENRLIGGYDITPVEVPDNNLLACYDFSGSADDISGNNHHGTLRGNPLFVPGKVGQGLQFDGIDDYVSIAEDPSAFGTLKSFAITAWINLSTTEEYSSLLSARHANGSDYPDANFTFQVRHDSIRLEAKDMFTDSQFSAGIDMRSDWHHVAAVVHYGQCTKFYVDGLLTSIQSNINTVTFSDQNNILIGSQFVDETLKNHFVGILDELHIFGRALTQEEIAWLAGRRTPYFQTWTLLLKSRVSSMDMYNDGQINLRYYSIWPSGDNVSEDYSD